VTLEPCNHVGVTPACRQELLNAGIRRVIIGIMDPTSRGDGGAAVLARTGVQVETNILYDEALAVLRPWLTATIRRRPHLTWAYASEDGPQERTTRDLGQLLRGGADLLTTSEAVSEGVPGGHSSAHFTSPDHVAGSDLSNWLTDAYASGTRSVVLLGADHEVAASAHIDLIDQIVTGTERTGPSQALATVAHQVMPVGFYLADITMHHNMIVARFRRLEHERP
jgi:diaminohydroxyphosphoribosylaminopyrimidine deaminase / 5-amino-6-(5-phosphoribosylamino)uracil reductase